VFFFSNLFHSARSTGICLSIYTHVRMPRIDLSFRLRSREMLKICLHSEVTGAMQCYVNCIVTEGGSVEVWLILLVDWEVAEVLGFDSLHYRAHGFVSLHQNSEAVLIRVCSLIYLCGLCKPYALYDNYINDNHLDTRHRTIIRQIYILVIRAAIEKSIGGDLLVFIGLTNKLIRLIGSRIHWRNANRLRTFKTTSPYRLKIDSTYASSFSSSFFFEQSFWTYTSNYRNYAKYFG